MYNIPEEEGETAKNRLEALQVLDTDPTAAVETD